MQVGLRLSFCAKALRRTQPAQPVQLKIGLTNDQQAEVLEGLQEGDELIALRADFFSKKNLSTKDRKERKEKSFWQNH